MKTGIVIDDRFADHDTGPQHPERPERVIALMEHLQRTGLMDRLIRIEPEPADVAWVKRVHQPAYIDRLQSACFSGRSHIDAPDSAISRASYDVALLAVGGVLQAVDAVMQGTIDNAFCAVRPPGHHCEFDRSLGFCLMNNIAIAAEYLIHHYQLERVAIVDFDVHHGNGTQHLFDHRRDVLFISIHQDPHTLFPGTGFAGEVGLENGEGFTLNLPLAAESGDAAMVQAFEQQVIPALDRFAPQALLVSAGFDVVIEDPLAQLNLTNSCIAWITAQLRLAAARLCDNRLISTLEGGYDLPSLCRDVQTHLEMLLCDQPETAARPADAVGQNQA